MRFITDARDASLHGHITIVASPEEAPPTHFTNGNSKPTVQHEHHEIIY